MNGFNRFCAAATAVLMLQAVAAGQSFPHIVVGACGGEPAAPDDGLCPGGDAASLELFTDGALLSGAGHGPGIAVNAIHPLRHMTAGNFALSGVFQQAQFGGYAFGTIGFNDLGLDYAAAPYRLLLSKLPGPPSSFTVAIERVAYSHPTEFAIYTPSGAPRLVESQDTYPFGTQSNAGHVHPFWLGRRPGLMSWDIRFISPEWGDSQVFRHYFTTVPGRAELVPLDMSAWFNADVVDSDLSDAPVGFDGAGRMFVLDGLYGTSSGLPADGSLAGFELGGSDGVGLGGSNLNVLLDDGSLTSAAVVDLVATGQDDRYLSVEFLLAASGSFASTDTLNVSFEYGDGSMQPFPINRHISPIWDPYRPFDDWQQVATPRPWLAVGRSGDRSEGFARSTGSGIDGNAGENTFFFRSTAVVHADRVLERVVISDYGGAGRIGVFAMLAARKLPLDIVTESLPDAVEGQPYTVPIMAEGTPPFRNWSAVGLPAGLSMDSDTGVISGEAEAGAAAASPYLVTISVDDSIHLFDSSYPPETAMVDLMLTVVAPALPGDIDGDGQLTPLDIDLFVNVLLGLKTDPAIVDRSDLNDSGAADGGDVRPLMTAFGV